MMKKYAVDGLDGYPNELAHKLDDALAALKEIAKMEGPYSRDPLTHAENVIENLTNIANKAIAKVEGGE